MWHEKEERREIRENAGGGGEGMKTEIGEKIAGGTKGARQAEGMYDRRVVREGKGTEEKERQEDTMEEERK